MPVAARGDDDPGLILQHKFLHETGALFPGNTAFEEKNPVAVLAQPETKAIDVFGPPRQHQR